MSSPASSIAGWVNVAKPRGVTSRRVVDRVAAALGDSKAGHAGTLDPLASGVLVVALGSATRLIEYVQRGKKSYRAEFLLGQFSPSDDLESEVTLMADPPRLSREAIEQATRSFIGTIWQRPPVFSAVKVAGRRAYALARKGREVALDERPVVVESIVVRAWDDPRLSLDIVCGAGTYIRSLGRDLAASLGTAAVMSDLERTCVGPFTLDEACPWDVIETAQEVERWLLPVARGIDELPRIVVPPSAVESLAFGRPIELDVRCELAEVVAVDEGGSVLAVLAPASGLSWRVVRNLIGR